MRSIFGIFLRPGSAIGGKSAQVTLDGWKSSRAVARCVISPPIAVVGGGGSDVSPRSDRASMTPHTKPHAALST